MNNKSKVQIVNNLIMGYVNSGKTTEGMNQAISHFKEWQQTKKHSLTLIIENEIIRSDLKEYLNLNKTTNNSVVFVTPPNMGETEEWVTKTIIEQYYKTFNTLEYIPNNKLFVFIDNFGMYRNNDYTRNLNVDDFNILKSIVESSYKGNIFASMNLNRCSINSSIITKDSQGNDILHEKSLIL